MNRNHLNWIKWAASFAAGGMMLQAAGCNINSTDFVTATTSVITAGGVLYLVFRVLSN